MKMTSLQDLYLHTLKDIYYAEQQILKALPGMAEKASDAGLRQAFTDHVAETQGQIERLEQIFSMLGERAKGETCPAIEGILKESKELMSDLKDPDALDAGMIAAAQAVEHYEFTRYGTLASWARTLGHTEAVPLLEASRDEEIGADVKLTKLAEAWVNRQAAAA